MRGDTSHKGQRERKRGTRLGIELSRLVRIQINLRIDDIHSKNAVERKEEYYEGGAEKVGHTRSMYTHTNRFAVLI